MQCDRVNVAGTQPPLQFKLYHYAEVTAAKEARAQAARMKELPDDLRVLVEAGELSMGAPSAVERDGDDSPPLGHGDQLSLLDAV